MNDKPALLDGIRVLDLTTVIMGPFATHILADLGADVIKIEPPEGDSTRTYAPHGAPGVTGSFLNLNRNKRSIVLNLKRAEDRAALDRMIGTADVIVHNLRAPVMQRLGFDYAHCLKIKPDIIYCAAYGFGAAGPYAAKPAYDDLIQAASGFAAMFTPVTGAPAYAPAVLFDKLAGQAIAGAVLAGLYHRERTGEGQAIEVPMFETAVEFNLMENFSGAAFVPPKGLPGYARLASPDRRPFQTADGYACILPYSDQNWQDFFAYIERHDLVGDPRYLKLSDRASEFTFLYALIRLEATKRTTAQWITFCDGVNLPCMPVINLADIIENEHIEAVGLFKTVDHPHAGPYRSIRRPVSYSAAEFQLRHHAPLLGEHTREVLTEAGLPVEAIDVIIGSTV